MYRLYGGGAGCSQHLHRQVPITTDNVQWSSLFEVGDLVLFKHLVTCVVDFGRPGDVEKICMFRSKLTQCFGTLDSAQLALVVSMVKLMLEIVTVVS